MAELLFVEPQAISKWERGLCMPDYDNVENLKKVFNCSLYDILEPNTTISISENKTIDSNDNSIITDAEDESFVPIMEGILNSNSPQTATNSKKKEKKFFLLCIL